MEDPFPQENIDTNNPIYLNSNWMVLHYPFHLQLKHLNRPKDLHYINIVQESPVLCTNGKQNNQCSNMNEVLLYPEYPALQPEWDREDIQVTFFKCMKWQVEETLDPTTCPYHYFCDSTYPGNYPPAVDVLVAVFAASWYIVTLVIMVRDIISRDKITSKRYLLPSGPVSLPLILLALANGHRINSIFPLMSLGPAILQLVLVSALTSDTRAHHKDIKYAFFEASTISGILHASLYLDSILLPYYTGYDALVSSSFSGECLSCVCRNEALVVGGMLVHYRGWSVTMFTVVATLILRIICRLSEENKGKCVLLIKSVLENLGWILITVDSVYLIKYSPPEESVLRVSAFVSILVLICLQAIKKMITWIKEWHFSKCKLKQVCTEKECDSQRLCFCTDHSDRES